MPLNQVQLESCANLSDIILYRARTSFSEAYQPPEGCAQDIFCLTAPDNHISVVLCFYNFEE